MTTTTTAAIIRVPLFCFARSMKLTGGSGKGACGDGATGGGRKGAGTGPAAGVGGPKKASDR